MQSLGHIFRMTARRGPRLSAIALGFLLSAAVATGSLAAGGGGGGNGGGGGGGSGGSSGGSAQTCKKGEIWSIWKRQCVPARSGALPDDEIVDYAFALAEEHRYDEALTMLDLMQGPQTAKSLNYRGYVTRKLGRTEEGIGYYLQSVALDPKYPQVREYLGEAYVIQGKLDLAKDQLKVIETLCGTTCEEYEDLDHAIKASSGL
ncbi:hypothetical protein [Bosea sp. 117]|uniref:tetratricopeptide repeat protein n=1 Tax=Bosea sp. 117 TaxID=1125973 RepID=UPI0020C0847E|nr:hypothetical protein [Bosea sp. 117]